MRLCPTKARDKLVGESGTSRSKPTTPMDQEASTPAAATNAAASRLT